MFLSILGKETQMPETADLTFYRSPAAAIAAPPEELAYVAAFDPRASSATR